MGYLIRSIEAKRFRLRAALIAALAIPFTLFGTVRGAYADNYPTRPIRVVVPYAPGGTGDVIARLVGQKLESALGQSVVIDNRPGGIGTIGASTVAKAEPDGYTVLLGYTSEMVISPHLVKGISYQTERDFQPVAFAGSTPLLLVANPSVPARNVQELITAAKAKPKAVSYASAGNGSPAHIAGALLAKSAGVEMLHVPYKGGSQAVTDVLGGNVDIYFSGIPPALPFVKTGKLVALGVASTKPTPALPQVPPLAAQFPQLDLAGWFGFFAPKNTPSSIVTQLNRQITATLQLPEIKSKLSEQGVETSAMTPDQFGRFVKAEQNKYQSLLKDLDIKQD